MHKWQCYNIKFQNLESVCYRVTLQSDWWMISFKIGEKLPEMDTQLIISSPINILIMWSFFMYAIQLERLCSDEQQELKHVKVMNVLLKTH